LKKQAGVRKQQSDEQEGIVLVAKNRVREGVWILLLAISAYLLVALSTYHSSDPGWSTSGAGGMIVNAGGRVGAWVADVFISLFGYVAYILPVLLASSGWFILFKKAGEEEGAADSHQLWRIGGFILSLLSACALLDFYQSFYDKNYLVHFGGIFGYFIDMHLIGLLNVDGTGLILIAFFLIGVTLCTGWSWISICKIFLNVILKFFKKISRTSSRLHYKYLAWRDRGRDKKRVIKTAEAEMLSKPLAPSIEHEIALKVQDNKLISNDNFVKHKEIKAKPGQLPPLSLLDEPEQQNLKKYSPADLESLSREIEQHLTDFGVEATVVGVHPGPVITRFELRLAPGLKVSKISSLVKDLARSLSVSSVRIVEVIPGKSVIGLELPNIDREIVRLKKLFSTPSYQEAFSPLTLTLGKDISGYPVVVDLGKMPHVLIAGTTGSGKSMCINAMLFSILFKATPEQVRLIMVDPKMLELSIYDGLPHLLTPVVTDMREATNAFRWCIAEMERRYQLLASVGVRNLAGFNQKVKEASDKGEPLLNTVVKPLEAEAPPELETMPNIIIVVDELADLMMVTGYKVEELITRIAQKARAVGIHMILATQRPSVDVITGLIKANIPTRISFRVSSRIDSRTILDQAGAEQLLGYGDMLYLPPGTSHPIRVHGGYVADDEVHRVVKYLKAQGEPDYHEEILENPVETTNGEPGEEAEQDPLYDEAIAIVTESRRASISYVQRRLKIGYNRAARMLEDMESAGVVTEMGVNGSREVLAPPPVSD